MLNVICLVGRLTDNVEIYKSKDSTIGTFYLAFDQGKEDEAGFIKCKCFNQTAEACANFLTKGDKIGVTGRILHRKFERKDGSKGSEIEIILNSVEFVELTLQDEQEEKPVAKPTRKSR